MIDIRTAKERKDVDRYLRRHGLGGLDDPKLAVQLAFLVQDHDQFRSMLMVLDPQRRHDMYEALAPNLRFDAKPLDVYVAEAAANFAAAESREHGAIKVSGDETTAEEAIRDARAQGWLELTCVKCTRTECFPGVSRLEAIELARRAGWVYQRMVTQKQGKEIVKEVEICPHCPTSARAN